MSSEDVQYLKNTIGKPLVMAIAEITAKQPRDPIHYLAHWLIKYRYNQEIQQQTQREVDELTAERDRLRRERLKRLMEQEIQDALSTMIMRTENLAYQHEIEAAMLKRMQMLTDEEEEEGGGAFGEPPPDL